MSDRQAGRDDIITGFALTLGLHVAVGALTYLLILLALIIPFTAGMWMLAWFLLLLGVTQLVYMVPAILIARWRGRPHTAMGLIIGAPLTFVLNAACWALLNPQGLQNLLGPVAVLASRGLFRKCPRGSLLA
jgi:hypothetical protein